MTDPRPRPKYGEYAPIPPGGTPQPEPAAVRPDVVEPVVEQVEPTKRPRDFFVSVVLLVIAVWDVVSGFAQYGNLADLIQVAYTQMGVGEFTATALAASMGTVINVGRVVVLLLVIGLTLWRIARGKTSFWIPLIGGALALVLAGVCTMVVMASDPAFVEFSQSFSGQ